ncbi:amidase [Catelliglobosispora koreensis]|uniref:amidase n=1 Tax=Catelliglobosispora koreensis TaxID=129052 RepID=UPI0004778D51|nr:amidase [Catelliglobosispora koreensis]
MSALHHLSALEQGDLIHNGEVTPQELAEHYLKRIERIDPQVGAFVTVRQDTHVDNPWSPLNGVPTAIKDNIPTAGLRTTFGSRALEHFVPEVDGHLVTLIRNAGLVSLGKTNTPEFALSVYSDNDVARSSRTPWDPSRSAGGSSGGAAAAVAAGLVPVAHANDGGGSVRIPASACGVFGLKTSRGRVSPGPLGVDLFGLTVQGAISRTVADAAALLDVMAVPMPGDPHWAPPLPAGETFLQAAQREPGKLRIAAYTESGFDSVTADPECVKAFEETRRLLVDLGHDVEDIKDPYPQEVIGIFQTLWAAQSLRFRVANEDELRPITRWWRERGRTLQGGAVIDAMYDAQLLARKIVTELARFDAVLTPTLAMPPVAPGWFSETGDPADEIQRQTRFSPFAGGANLTGQPSASLPLYWTPDGLPIGSMVSGRPAGEAQLLSLCAQLERAKPWKDRWPSP